MEILKEMNESEFQTYVRFEPVRNLDAFEARIKKLKVIACNFAFGWRSMLSAIKNYEEKNFNRKAEKDGKARYGMEIILLLPLGDWSNSRLVSLSARFVRMVVGKESGLKYLSFLSSKGKARYLHIYIYDREYLGGSVPKRYKRDFLINSITKKVTTKDDPDAQILYKKGEIQRDVNGKEIRETFKATKTRIFAYKDGQFESWKAMFVDFFVNSLRKMKVNIKEAFLIRRKNLRKAYNRFSRRIIIANNQLIQYIQDQCNLYYSKSMKVPDAYDIAKNSYSPGDLIITKAAKEMREILEKYRKVFSEGQFREEGFICKIFDCRCDEVEENIIKLKALFKEDLRKWSIAEGVPL